MENQSDDPAAIREAVGVFADADKVGEAIDALLARGFQHREIGLLAGEFTVRQSLGEFYSRTNESVDSVDGPATAFVAREKAGVHALLGSLVFAGSTAGAGAAVATAAILGGGLAAALGGAAAIGAVGAVLALVIHASDAEELEMQVEEGHLLLFVRVRDSGRERDAVQTLQRYAPIEVKVVNAGKAS